MNKVREIDTRKFKKILKDMGFFQTKCGKGSHEVWQTQDGKTFSFPSNNKTVKSGIVWNFIRLTNMKHLDSVLIS